MTWTLIDSATERDTVLEFYGKDGRFMIRANGLELMNGFSHESETVLGAFAAGLAPTKGARFLVGGLGLGYTAAALLEALGDGGVVTVAELSSAVIDWFHRHVKAAVLPEIHGNLTIVNADIADLLAEPNRYDVVILDVDNGPEPLVTEANARLYSANGLRALHGCLSDRGVALVWSGFQSGEFAARAEEAGFAVTCEPFRRERAELDHYIYVFTKNGAAPAQGLPCGGRELVSAQAPRPNCPPGGHRARDLVFRWAPRAFPKRMKSDVQTRRNWT